MSSKLGASNEGMIANFIAGPMHAAIVTGEQFHYLVNDIVRTVKKQDKGIVATTVQPEKQSIQIDQIRELKHGLSLKQGAGKRLVIISQAGTMTHQAQNSFLKLLEEPIAGVYFLLLSESAGKLLPTVVSRCVLLHSKRISLVDAQQCYTDDSNEFIRLYAISGGAPGKLAAITADGSAYVDAIAQAKSIVSSSHYERLLLVDSLAKSDHLTIVLRAMDDVLLAVTRASAAFTQIKSAAQKRKVLHQALKALEQNANAKLVLTDVFLQV